MPIGKVDATYSSLMTANGLSEYVADRLSRSSSTISAEDMTRIGVPKTSMYTRFPTPTTLANAPPTTPPAITPVLLAPCGRVDEAAGICDVYYV